MNKAFLSIGTNKGSKIDNIKRLIFYLSNHSIYILNKSSLYETEPIGYKKQTKFYNIVLEVEFEHTSNVLFFILKNIEHQMGRNFYKPRNSPRIIDIDILTYNNAIINNNMLTIPHIELHNRKFVLAPWSEISSDYIVPNFNQNINKLLNDTQDVSIIRKLDNKY